MRMEVMWVIWHSDQCMGSQNGIDCDGCVDGQPWSLVMTLNLNWNLIWSDNIPVLELKGRAKEQRTEIELALIHLFVPLITPATQDSILSILSILGTLRLNTITGPPSQDTAQAQLCVTPGVLGSTGPVWTARGNVGCDILLCHWR